MIAKTNLIILAFCATLGMTEMVNAAPERHSQTASLSVPRGNPKSQILEGLYRKLRLAQDSEYAHTIEKKIEDVWLDSGSSTVNLLMARALRIQAQRKYTVCLHLLNEIIRIAPGYAEGWYQRSYVHFENNNFTLALIDIRQVLALDPHNFQAINGLGLILREVGNKKAALKVFKRLLEIHPHYENAKKAVEQLTLEVDGQNT